MNNCTPMHSCTLIHREWSFYYTCNTNSSL